MDSMLLLSLVFGFLLLAAFIWWWEFRRLPSNSRELGPGELEEFATRESPMCLVSWYVLGISRHELRKQRKARRRLIKLSPNVISLNGRIE